MTIISADLDQFSKLFIDRVMFYDASLNRRNENTRFLKLHFHFLALLPRWTGITVTKFYFEFEFEYDTRTLFTNVS